MTRHHRRRSAVADIRHRLRQGLQPHLANIVKENNKPLTEFPRFMDLPLELRRQIYPLVMEDHTIHIELLFRHDDTSGSPYGYTCIPAYFICKSKLCEAERYELFCKRGDPQTEILHPRDRHELSHLHRRCQYGIPTTRRLDLSLARVSKETHREAMKMFYTRSTFSFDKASDIGPWLAAIPEGMKSLVRSLHFEMTLVDNVLGPAEQITDWAQFFSERVVIDFAGLRSLTVAVHMQNGYVSCWRLEPGPEFTAIFEGR